MIQKKINNEGRWRRSERERMMNQIWQNVKMGELRFSKQEYFTLLATFLYV